MSKTSIRRSLLVLGLALSLAASWWTHHQELAESALATPAAREDRPLASRPAAGVDQAESTANPENIHLDLKRLSARELAGTDIDPFRAKSWYVPPPPPPPEPPAKPTAPPLPFQFMGKTEESGSKPIVYLANGEEFYAVSVGERFAGSYQLEKVDRGTLVILYLPLAIKQTLQIGMSE